MNGTLSDMGQRCLVDFSIQFIKDFLSMFYIMSIEETTKDSIHDVPNYEVMLFPIIGILIMAEQLVRLYQRKDLSRLEDCVINVGSAFIFTLARVFLYVVVIELFDYIHRNYAIIHLPLHNPWTWIFSLIMVEFVYYWTHRALHELNILWAAHQFHHMAEDINITTTVRDSIVDLIIYDIFPIPLAFIVPAQILAVHIQFSLIYQVWLHNDVVGHLGPLEYLINTPRQHRVHHGKNPYCIDKNYGALLMIWDRMFGTYQEEDRKEKIIFGVVSPTPKTFDPWILQFGYYKDVWLKMKSVNGFRNKLYCLIKGPGWSPGKPRLGLISDVPKPDPDAPKYTYTPYVEVWKKVYVYVHSFIIVLGFYLIADHPLVRFSPWKGFMCMIHVIFTLTSFGAIFDNRWFSAILEIYRCLAYFIFDYYLIASVNWPVDGNTRLIINYSIWLVRIIHIISIIFWLIILFIQIYRRGKLFNISFGNRDDNNIIKTIDKQKNVTLNEMKEEEMEEKKIKKKKKKMEMEEKEEEMMKTDELMNVDKELNLNDQLNVKPMNNRYSIGIALLGIILLLGSVLIFIPIYVMQVPSCNRLVESI